MLRQLVLRNNVGEELGRGDMVRIYNDPVEGDPDRQSIAIYPSVPGPPIVFTVVTGGEIVIEAPIGLDDPGPPTNHS